MLRIEPLRAGHVAEFELAPDQAPNEAFFRDLANWRQVFASPYFWAAARNPAGRLVCLAGVTRVWPGRAVAAVWLSRHLSARDWPELHRWIEAYLVSAHSAGARRIEATVAADFEAGQRWMLRLGFEREGLLKAYGPDGADHIGYARVAAPLAEAQHVRA